ncbi:ZIP family metal transporter [Aerococcaceae bacterium DSM 111020]|nr:ZIP family metal transporter [Aerococcaceae bacterium DSM 111020]
MEWFLQFNPIVQAGLAGVFTWLCTALGSSLVFFVKKVNVKLLDIMNGFAAGVMMAASYWSLLAPAIQHSENMGYGVWSFVPALVGFVTGGLFLRLIDIIVPHLHFGNKCDQAEGPDTALSSTALLFLAITIHNIPEGLSIGVAFGSLAFDPSSAALASAIALAIGIGLQNFPEGAALALPIRAEGTSAGRAFNLGQASALVEIVSAIIGAWLINQVYAILPYALAFAAGAMVFVCVEELIPSSQSHDNTDIATLAFIIGFAVMMTLDVALG